MYSSKPKQLRSTGNRIECGESAKALALESRIQFCRVRRDLRRTADLAAIWCVPTAERTLLLGNPTEKCFYGFNARRCERLFRSMMGACASTMDRHQEDREGGRASRVGWTQKS